MRVTVVTLFYPPSLGGTQTATAFAAEALLPEHDVTVICSNHDPGASEEVINGVRVVRCARLAMVARQPIPLGLAKAIRESRPDVLHFHAPDFWAAAVIAFVFPRVPLVFTHHMDVAGRRLLKQALMPLSRRLARRAAAVIVSHMRNFEQSSDLPRDLARVVAIPIPVDAAAFARSPAERARLQRQRQADHGDRVLVGFLGRLVWYKGLDHLIDAMSGQAGARLLVAGAGPLREPLERRVAALGLEDSVQFLGALDDRERTDLLHTIDMLVLPSTSTTEAFGIVQAEAQHCGKPVIATRLPTGASALVADGETGLLVEPGDADALREAIGGLVRDPALRTRQGRAAEARSRALFDRGNHDAAVRAVFARVDEARKHVPAGLPRVLFLAAVPDYIGGAERVLADLMRNPLVSPELAVPGPGALADTLGPEVQAVHMLDFGAMSAVRRPVRPLRALAASGAFFRAAWRLRNLCRQRGIDVVHANGLKPNWIALLARRLGGAPVVLRYHDIPNLRTEQWLWQRAGWLADGAGLVSRPCWPGRDLPRHVRVVHTGIAVPDAATGARNERSLTLGFVGRLHPWKGLERLLEWMRAGIEAGFDLELVVRGRFAEEPRGYRSEVQDTVERLGLAERVRFDGFVEGDTLYDGIDMLCVPSTMPDPLPRVVIEGQARGLFVIASPGGGIGEMIRHGETGWLVGETADFLAALRLPPEERARCARRGREQCIREFSLDAMWQGFAGLYRAAARMKQ